MKNKSHDINITKGELSAESQERRLRNYDPAKQPCKQGNSTCYGLDSIFCSNAIPHSLRGSHRLPTSRIRYEIHRFVLSTFAYKIRSSFIFGLDAPNSEE